MPLYKRLQTEVANTPGAPVRFRGLTAEDLPSAQSYLGSHDLKLSSVSQIRTNQVAVRGTPSLLLVDSSGLIVRMWTGRLSEALENDVIDAVQQSTASNASASGTSSN